MLSLTCAVHNPDSPDTYIKGYIAIAQCHGFEDKKKEPDSKNVLKEVLKLVKNGPIPAVFKRKFDAAWLETIRLKRTQKENALTVTLLSKLGIRWGCTYVLLKPETAQRGRLTNFKLRSFIIDQIVGKTLPSEDSAEDHVVYFLMIKRFQNGDPPEFKYIEHDGSEEESIAALRELKNHNPFSTPNAQEQLSVAPAKKLTSGEKASFLIKFNWSNDLLERINCYAEKEFNISRQSFSPIKGEAK